ncbi:hypothetical protein RHSIM_RhsimUnG0002800 [Rhododendron simsii]|uniref:Uncharacterized protein n=1 Tax=Rhododendron simsii TaxID=118357 RepID=A0A834G3U8_RHOSS|nr:hypothetical protein RHSIM_RhsimUnG0002800 [Rhododendron simsii]
MMLGAQLRRIVHANCTISLLLSVTLELDLAFDSKIDASMHVNGVGGVGIGIGVYTKLGVSNYGNVARILKLQDGRGGGGRAGAHRSGDCGGAAIGSSDDDECGRGVPFDFRSVGAQSDFDSRNSGNEGEAMGFGANDNRGGTRARESDSGVGGGGDSEEIITDEGGDEVVAEMEVGAVEATGILGQTREEKGKAPMVIEDVKTPVLIFDRPAGDSGVESTQRVTFLDYEEFVEDEDIF